MVDGDPEVVVAVDTVTAVRATDLRDQPTREEGSDSREQVTEPLRGKFDPGICARIGRIEGRLRRIGTLKEGWKAVLRERAFKFVRW